MKLDKYEKRAKHNISKSSLQSRLSGLRNLEQFIGGGEPTSQDVEEWVDHMIDEHDRGNIKASTIREYYKASRYYFDTVKGGMEPIEHISKWLPTNDSDPGDYLNEEEWDIFLNAIHEVKYKAIFYTMYYYARRPTEIIMLNEEDIDFEENTITFYILKKTDHKLPEMEALGDKRKKFRATYELKDDVAEYIKDSMRYSPNHKDTYVIDGEEIEVTPVFTTSHGRISYDSVYKKIKEIGERTGLSKNKTLEPKMMRHSRSTHLDWDKHAPGNIARDMLIHEPDTNVVGNYIHDRDEDEVREVMEVDKEVEE